MRGHVGYAVHLFVKENYNELPKPIEGKIRDGIAGHAGVKPDTFKNVSD
jgi:hypothetical protein